MDKSKPIRVVMFRDGNSWVAQCLEHDIRAQADSLEKLQSRLQFALNLEREASVEINGEPFKGIDPAPASYFEMWENCSMSAAPRSKSGGLLPGCELALCA